ncbi:MAG TPA: non-homologous end-joining DNA ligase [Nocardioidaceae bacterium]|nr:non-homologous end-joining DNA ligase [Nocardioidaceae bacterium]
MRPMLAKSGEAVPTGDAWTHEVKWDGIRVLVHVRGGKLRMYSRNENEVTAAWPELAGLADLPHELVLDGEVVGFLDGIPRFGALAERMHLRDRTKVSKLAEVNPVTLMFFDVLSIDGRDVTGEPLSMRRQLLEALDLNGPRWQTPPTYDDGPALLRATEQQDLEGIVSKRLASKYEPGRRTGAWLKFPNRPSDTYVVGGWRYETDSRSRIGAILVGCYRNGELVYCGRVGSGIAGKAGPVLQQLLEPLVADGTPFSDEIPKEDRVGTNWVRPEVVVEVASLGWTPQKRLRQPAYLGIRTDVTTEDLLDAP